MFLFSPENYFSAAAHYLKRSVPEYLICSSIIDNRPVGSRCLRDGLCSRPNEERSTPMPRYYFHVEDHHTTLDQVGVELQDIKVARQEALQAAGDMLRNGAGTSVWEGKPFRMWVTDQPGGEGQTFFTLYFSATETDRLRAEKPPLSAPKL
jgi:hypothetical protein